MSRHVDVHVGQRIRQRRWILNLTQKRIAERLGVQLQQLHHYETGANRVSASRLWDLATILEVPIAYFFAGLGDQAEETDANLGDLLSDREARMLVRAFYAIPQSQREHLLDLARVLGAVSSSTNQGTLGRFPPTLAHSQRR